MGMLGRFGAFVVVITFLVGCSRAGSQNAGPPGAGKPLSSFPVYSPGTVVTVGTYDDSVEVQRFGSSFFDEGQDPTKPYVGTQELIKTSATIDQLDAWVKQLVQSPPQSLLADGSNAHRVNGRLVDTLGTFGLVPSEFSTNDRGRVVMVLVLDPKHVSDHVGALMGVIDMWEKLPGPMRAGLDETIKKQAGISASDLMDPNTPLGMVVYAARNWKNEDARAIILVDAIRQPNSLPTPHSE